jgi:phosphoribosylaminoimidazolecarboxamide formyltransferase / IMP cyclohydrolase
MAENYLEVVCAPDYEEGTLAILAHRKNLRVIRIAGISRLADFEQHRFVDFKSLIDGGIIVQRSAVNSIRSAADLKPAITYLQRGHLQVRAATEPPRDRGHALRLGN